MVRRRTSTLSPTDRANREERAERILDSAAELLLRHGYSRITVDDVARRANVGKGTVYLHWRTREALFGALLLREVLAVWHALLERVRADPAEVLFHRVLRSMMLVGLSRPLGKALLTGDAELLGKLAQSSFGELSRSQQAMTKERYLTLLRDLGLLRSDTDITVQGYALRATVNGFLHLERRLTEDEQLPIEVKAEALAETVRRAFEPDELPADAALRAAAAEVTEWMEQLCRLTEQLLREQMEG